MSLQSLTNNHLLASFESTRTDLQQLLDNTVATLKGGLEDKLQKIEVESAKALTLLTQQKNSLQSQLTSEQQKCSHFKAEVDTKLTSYCEELTSTKQELELTQLNLILTEQHNAHLATELAATQQELAATKNQLFELMSLQHALIAVTQTSNAEDAKTSKEIAMLQLELSQAKFEITQFKANQTIPKKAEEKLPVVNLIPSQPEPKSFPAMPNNLATPVASHKTVSPAEKSNPLAFLSSVLTGKKTKQANEASGTSTDEALNKKYCRRNSRIALFPIENDSANIAEKQTDSAAVMQNMA